MSRHRLFSSSLRLSARLNQNIAARSHRTEITRRMMSSDSHASHGSSSSDTPWMIGSALVFGPLFLYLVSPSARKGHDHGHAEHAHKSHHDEHEDKHAQHVESRSQGDAVPIADDEGTEVSGQEVKESMEKAFKADSPKDAQEREEVVAKEMAAVEEHSATETHQDEGATDATPVPESEPNPAPVVPVEVDLATQATGEEKAQSATTLESATESKA